MERIELHALWTIRIFVLAIRPHSQRVLHAVFFALVSPYKKTGCASAVLAVLIASETFLLPPVKLWMDEGGVNSAHVVAFGPGFYLWYGSLLIVLVAVFARLGNKTQPQATPVE